MGKQDTIAARQVICKVAISKVCLVPGVLALRLEVRTPGTLNVLTKGLRHCF